ncbi:competence protein ComK [Lederbergia panacisoli]|uniref:competence protein ComK n=1 Tax=Lederbergia panacisoli TaxID=1255251 RepID=UPI00214C4745|nr:competence protein ComK [Lederbergia panacisoli]MCR2821034.1 competence protein ComK [Lederbergia panacisoli]
MLKTELFLEEYEINPYTVMIKPYIKDDEVYSEIFELDDHFIVRQKPLDIVKKGCKYFGSSFEGRRAGTKSLIMVTHKPPIIIDPNTSIYLIPTTSPTRPDCIWISHDHITSIHRGENNNSIISFQNNQSFEIPISLSSLSNQLSRAAQLRVSFQQNIERMEFYTSRPPKPKKMRAAEFKKIYRINRKK